MCPKPDIGILRLAHDLFYRSHDTEARAQLFLIAEELIDLKQKLLARQYDHYFLPTMEDAESTVIERAAVLSMIYLSLSEYCEGMGRGGIVRSREEYVEHAHQACCAGRRELESAGSCQLYWECMLELSYAELLPLWSLRRLKLREIEKRVSGITDHRRAVAYARLGMALRDRRKGSSLLDALRGYRWQYLSRRQPASARAAG
jgi:hypothetical protein